MHARRLLLVGSVSLGLLVILVAPAVGQTESATWVTGTMDCGLAEQGTSQEDASVRLDQFPGQCTATMSDPRVERHLGERHPRGVLQAARRALHDVRDDRDRRA